MARPARGQGDHGALARVVRVPSRAAHVRAAAGRVRRVAAREERVVLRAEHGGVDRVGLHRADARVGRVAAQRLGRMRVDRARGRRVQHVRGQVDLHVAAPGRLGSQARGQAAARARAARGGQHHQRRRAGAHRRRRVDQARHAQQLAPRLRARLLLELGRLLPPLGGRPASRPAWPGLAPSSPRAPSRPSLIPSPLSPSPPGLARPAPSRPGRPAAAAGAVCGVGTSWPPGRRAAAASVRAEQVHRAGSRAVRARRPAWLRARVLLWRCAKAAGGVQAAAEVAAVAASEGRASRPGRQAVNQSIGIIQPSVRPATR